MKSKWVKAKLVDKITFNPKLSLKKGTLAKKVAMEHLIPFTKYIPKYDISTFSGGSKFENGDTLFARITPCLENGKTAQVKILDKGEIGFGSTEFIVLRGKSNITDKDFIYYLSISPDFRNYAIKSMVGSSGRQRVQQNVLENMNIQLPSIEEQQAIAATLSCLDDKIELNNRINKNLEEQAQAIFISWFVNFEPFKDGEFVDSELGRIPKGWSILSLNELIEIIDNRGKTPPLSNDITSYPILDVKALSSSNRIIEYGNCSKYVNETIYKNWFRNGHPKPYDILLSTVGSLAEIKLFLGGNGCIAQNVVALRSTLERSLYLFEYLKYIKKDLISYNIGSVQPSIKVTHIIRHAILLPSDDVIKQFSDILYKITKQIFNNYTQNQTLASIRDTLLPKLMSGEIEVPLEV